MDSKSSGAFSAADINFIQDLHDNMRRDIANGREYGGLLSTISRHLERFQEASITAAALEEFPSWGPVVCIPDASPGNDQRAVQITGPLIDDHFQITTASSPEMAEIVHYVSAIDVASQKLEEIRNRALAVIQKKQKLEQEQSGLKQPAEITVDDHIRLLRQYNKTKDVGQQLIGLIAESRSLPIGTIYKDGDYGVCADD